MFRSETADNVTIQVFGLGRQLLTWRLAPTLATQLGAVRGGGRGSVYRWPHMFVTPLVAQYAAILLTSRSLHCMRSRTWRHGAGHGCQSCPTTYSTEAAHMGDIGQTLSHLPYLRLADRQPMWHRQHHGYLTKRTGSAPTGHMPTCERAPPPGPHV